MDNVAGSEASPALMQKAMQALQGGRFAEAEDLFRQVLATDPFHAGARHFLGVVLLQKGELDAATGMIRESLVIEPSNALAHCNLANCLCQKNRLEESIAESQEAIRLDPRLAEAHNTLGVALQRQGQLAEAVKAFGEALAVRPQDARTLSNLGNALHALGRYGEAISFCREAIRLRPDYATAYNNLGVSLSELRHYDEAISVLENATRLRPDLAEAHKNLGSALMGKKQLPRAIECFRRAVDLRPDFAEAYADLSDALRLTGQLNEAMKAGAKSVQLKPNLAKGYVSLGEVASDTFQYDQAIAAYDQALELKPNMADAHNGLANTLCLVGRLDEAIEHYRKAISLAGDKPVLHSNLVFTLNYHPDFTTEMILAEQRRWNEQHGEPLKDRIQVHENDRNPDRRLRIGYVSPDFRDHVVGANVLPLIREHDRAEVEVFCYSYAQRLDGVTDLFRGYADRWCNILGMTHEQAAEQIREDRIDVLVDLALHTGHGRLLVFARKPAPVQVAFAGYPGGTGLSAMDWRLTDPYLDPPGVTDGNYVERSYRLADSFWCYDPRSIVPAGGPLEPGPLPANANGYVTFGSANNFMKVSDEVIKLWSRVIRGVERSRLFLLCPEGDCRKALGEKFEAEGVDPSRLELTGRQQRRQYFELYQKIDIGLDTFPYNGHTTSLDAFWMGVPVVTLVGKTVVGRAGVSQLSNLKLQELIAQSPEEYVKIATGLATNLPRLAHLRGGLRSRMLASPLTDAKRFARNIESAYRSMWREWCGKSL